MTSVPLRRRHLAALLAAVSIVLAARASEAVRPRVDAPILLRLEGYVGKAPEGVTRLTHLVMEYQGQNCEFDLAEMVVVTGERSSSQVLQDVSPYRVNFILRGPPPALAPLTGAATGQKLIITAHYRTGTRDLLIETIRIAVDPTPTPS